MGQGGSGGGRQQGTGFHDCQGGNYGGGYPFGPPANPSGGRTGQGAVRIIWDHVDFATTRAFPSTNTGELGDREP